MPPPSQPPPSAGEKTRSLEVRARDVRVPSALTTYHCEIVPLPDALRTRKHHAVRYAAIVTPGNEHLVHHMELFHCRSPPAALYSGECGGEQQPENAESCSQVVVLWAMGAEVSGDGGEMHERARSSNFVAAAACRLSERNWFADRRRRLHAISQA